MKLILLVLFLSASCQDYNSNSSDRDKYGPNGLNESDPNYAQAYKIIQNRCVNCHSGTHNIWATFKNNQAWLDDPKKDILKGDPTGSEFIKRIINSGESNSDMPQGGSALPNDEYQHLRDWITNMP